MLGGAADAGPGRSARVAGPVVVTWERINVYVADCDVPGCEGSEDFVPYAGKGLRGARAEAKRQGWTVDDDGAMRCPKHREAAS